MSEDLPAFASITSVLKRHTRVNAQQYNNEDTPTSSVYQGQTTQNTNQNTCCCYIVKRGTASEVAQNVLHKRDTLTVPIFCRKGCTSSGLTMVARGKLERPPKRIFRATEQRVLRKFTVPFSAYCPRRCKKSALDRCHGRIPRPDAEHPVSSVFIEL